MCRILKVIKGLAKHRNPEDGMASDTSAESRRDVQQHVDVRRFHWSIRTGEDCNRVTAEASATVGPHHDRPSVNMGMVSLQPILS